MQAEILGGLRDAVEPERLAFAVAVRHHQRHVDAAGAQHAQAAVADVRVGEDDGPHAATSVMSIDAGATSVTPLDDASSTALIR